MFKFKNDLENICQSESMDRTSRRRAGQLISSMKANKRKNNDALPSTVFSNQGSALSNNGTIIVNVISGAKEVDGSKRQKVDHVEDADSWQVESEEDLWDAWRQFLKCCCCCHDFCIPQQLYDHLDTATVAINNLFKQHPEYSLAVLEALKPLPKNWKAARKAVVNPEDNDDDNEGEESKEFLQELFLIMQYYFVQEEGCGCCIKKSEVNYNLFVLWPLMSLAAGDMNFVAGEYILKASKEEYRADACILDENDNEICLLESSGCYLFGDKCKYGYDHVKGAFGVLTMFNAAFKKYHKASFKVAQELSILFIHARHDAIHLWSLELCSQKMYVLKKVYVAKTPVNSHVIALGNLFWCLKTMIKKTACVLKKMKESHEQNELKMMMGEETSPSLFQFVDIDIQKPVKGAGYGILLPEEKEEQDIVIKYV
ncbi:uncharacterized protein B0P05DRAFT_638008 [Gilbertella persicaria]|uniref:uncharacterized protein n=1 Tax=Gilbertella persicaria TaxID=101096 RepID=UPI00221E6C66|nr:uncharacterized protein B0P05DRAFT_638008 [Gilbertella persicaria]KAI8077303.1 hypothetical protein B0P05DRAFT_638008 [Gilbertella persicaria]